MTYKKYCYKTLLVIYFFMRIGGGKLEKTKVRKKKNNGALRKANLIFILIFAIAIILVLIELNIAIKKKNELPTKTSINTKNIINDTDDEKKNIEEVNEGLSFETFVDKVYTEEEIRDFSSEEMREVRQIQIDKKNTSDLAIQKIAGSTSSKNAATRIVTNLYNTKDQVVRSSEVILETKNYYIVMVEWDYISVNTSKRQKQQVLVFKDFYYDMNKNILNMDDIDNVKDILDLKYYIETYSNTGKNIIQSFIRKDGEKSEYVIYYFDVEYGEEGMSNIIYLTSDILQINSETGSIENIQTSQISNGVRL